MFHSQRANDGVSARINTAPLPLHRYHLYAPLPPVLPVVICSVAFVMQNVAVVSWLVTGAEPSSVCAVQVGRGGGGGGRSIGGRHELMLTVFVYTPNR